MFCCRWHVYVAVDVAKASSQNSLIFTPYHLPAVTGIPFVLLN